MAASPSLVAAMEDEGEGGREEGREGGVLLRTCEGEEGEASGAGEVKREGERKEEREGGKEGGREGG